MATRKRKASNKPSPAVDRAASDVVSEDSRRPFPIACIGASAGGLEALSALLETMPVDTGVGFVIIQHLSPTHPSMLVDILSRTTSMPVIEVTDDQLVDPNCVHVIPPDREVTIQSGHLELHPREKETARRRPVDRFLRSLAADQGARAIGVILSGTGSDGTLGIEELKGEGGITFAQDETAQQRGMPDSAIATGCIDFILSPKEIAAEIDRLGKSPHLTSESAKLPAGDAADFATIVQLMRSVTGVDFTQYRSTTLFRRITRRMALLKIEEAGKYIELLTRSEEERNALYHDILISVTSFFRDPEMFESLTQRVLPRMFEGRSDRDPLRVWVLGCSTGQEAYSIAIALDEFRKSRGLNVPVQVFATDLNESGITTARAGLYARDIEHDLSDERLKNYFTAVDGQYRVAKSIREMCVFARHNLLADPPFSRMDLVTCRNLLIYINPVLQEKIIPILHYALRPGGALVLGGSETVGTHGRDLFETEDARQRIYRRKDGAQSLPFVIRSRETSRQNRSPELRRARDATLGADIQREAELVLLRKYAPAGVLLNSRMEIVQFQGDTTPYLAPGPGRASLNVMKMAKEGLEVILRSALHQARTDGLPARREGVELRSKEGPRMVDLEVTPLLEGSDGGGFLVVFQEPSRATGSSVPPSEDPAARDQGAEPSSRVLALTQELSATREYLQSIIEQHDAANEELQSANEEAQSANEEMQSVNEELETSKEEIQSSNEELATVNDELRDRNSELSRLNNDVSNLLGSVRIPIVMFDPELRIRRFTEIAQQVLGLNPADIGRPIAAMRFADNFQHLPQLLDEVIANGTEKDLEVQDILGSWYSMRLLPYLTHDGGVEGAVLLMIDIDAIRKAREFAESIVATVREPLLVLDGELRVQSASGSFCETFGVSAGDTVGQPFYDLGRGHWKIPELRRLLDEVLPQGQSFDDLEVSQEFDRIGRRTMLLNGRRVTRAVGEPPLILLAIQDITVHASLLEAQRQARQVAEESDAAKDQFLAAISHELRTPLTSILGWTQLVAQSEYEPALMRKGIESIEMSASGQARLINDLLDSARMLAGKFELNMLPLDISDVVEAAVAAALPLAASKSIEIRTSRASATVSADRLRLLQVFGNLLSNAIKFSPPSKRIHVKIEPENEHVTVCVTDQGSGITREFLPRVFDRYRQYHGGAYGGLGLGLAIVRHLVDAHGGSVKVESEGEGRGATFRVVLPIAAADVPHPSDGLE